MIKIQLSEPYHVDLKVDWIKMNSPDGPVGDYIPVSTQRFFNIPNEVKMFDINNVKVRFIHGNMLDKLYDLQVVVIADLKMIIVVAIEYKSEYLYIGINPTYLTAEVEFYY